ncbi:hypothetical protein CYLTODRAFT_452187 [Cylindrobasidium torrendii FP15055 ss-10]|uniref:F-box domain-containing protein n=1 Tax=Cylindrobasidium torrendii FP15055 ss-10 TaxID=1314674 RepID=A0A0D7BHI8_9AGAR|nr:hypothetical protein CYLTODRAFT_452187 [Cylindrobasidium torrendii FP15055 ss-10]
MTDLSLGPSLPVELVEAILETGAILHRKLALQFCILSKSIRARIDPILYHTVVIDDHDIGEAFQEAIRLRNDRLFFANTVKILVCKWHCLSEAGGQLIIDACTGVYGLTECLDSAFTPLRRGAAAFSHLRYLTLGNDSCAFLDYYSCASALCANLTRLSTEIGWMSRFPPDDIILSIFTLCPNITHLCFQIRTWDTADSCAQKAFDEWDRAGLLPSTLRRVLVIAFPEAYGTDNALQLADLRRPHDSNDNPRMAFVAIKPASNEASARRIIARTTRDNAFGAAGWGNLDANRDDFYDLTDKILDNAHLN